MQRIREFFRLISIYGVLMRYGLDQIILSLHLFSPIRFILYFNPWHWIARHKTPRGKRIREALEILGPVFVKFGQMIATRRDVLPEDIADELAYLHDKVMHFPGADARALIEMRYEKSVTELFQHFEETPLASASIAQVHAATLKDGRHVVIKVLRPGIKKIIQRDIALLYLLARLAERYWKASLRLRPCAVVAEFERTILDELDFVRECANASQLRRNFQNSAILYVPEIYWPYAKSDVLMMERIHGTPISNVDELKRQHIDLKKLAECGVEIFFTQVFRDCFFHADMHPGNIFVAQNEVKYLVVDFGIMGSLSPHDQRYIAENLLAFFNRDYRRVAVLHIESGWVDIHTRIDEFEAAVRTVCEPIFERPFKDISFAQLLLKLFQIAARFNMQVQPQLILLQKTLLSVEGLGRQLYPDLDLWTTAKPFLERWLRTQMGPRALIRKIRENAPYWAEKLPELPDLLFEIAHHQKAILLQRSQLSSTHLHTQEFLSLQARRQGLMVGFLMALLVGSGLMFLYHYYF